MNWKSIIATALITGVVTIATGMFLFWWQIEKEELTYNSIQSIPFDDASNTLFIQQIEISNSGDKPTDDVVLIISFSEEIIQKSKISIENSISHKETSGEKSIELEIDSLNPGEGANVSVLYLSKKSNSSGAKISLRAKGVTGKPIGSNGKDNKKVIGIALTAAYAGLLSLVLSTKRGRIAVTNVLRGRLGASTQKHIIASTLSMYGYPDKAKEYLCSDSNRQYWVEADLLAAEAILENEQIMEDTIKVLHVISELENIAESSKAITFYNIARINKVLKKDDAIITEFLETAKKLDKSEIEARLLRDPVFV